MSLHARETPNDGLHSPYAWTFANAAAREAFTVADGWPTSEGDLTSDDLNKWALDLDTGIAYRLSSIGPTVWVAAGTVAGTPQYSTKFFEGLHITNTSLTERTIEPGVAVADSQEALIRVTAPILLSTAVSGVGGLDQGALSPDTHYAIWLISDGTNVEAVFSEDFDQPFAPGYTEWRRIGWCLTDGSSQLRGATLVSPPGQRNREWSYERVGLLQVFSGAIPVYPAVQVVDVSQHMPPSATQGYLRIRLRSQTNAISLLRARQIGDTGAGQTILALYAAGQGYFTDLRQTTDANQQFEINANGDGSADTFIGIARFFDPI